MAKSKSGRPFEKLVALIQQAYNDSPHTKIFTNHRIKDRFGKYREFDVFIIVKSNDYDFKIAIECKDYNSPVSVEKIEAFNSKCSTVSGINKKVIISSNGFQSGAKENANLFDIELQTLSNIKRTEVSHRDTGYMGIKFEILDYVVIVNDELFGEVHFSKAAINDRSTTAHLGDTPLPILQYLNQVIYKQGATRSMVEVVQKEAMRRGVLLVKEDVAVTDFFVMTPTIGHPLKLYMSGKELQISRIDIKANVTCRAKDKNSSSVEARSHNDILNSKKGELYAVQFDEGAETNFFYEQHDSEGKYIGTIAVNHGHSINLSSRFRIDTTSGKFVD